ncbi:Uncharacterised protein [Listeria ivanovii subsp. londoniensis]|uniref:Uncharacterized protein n=1 Tax=Listeria ivanovii TaxID=1638 RepID=A0AAX2DQZ2_LISIV|nr:hypothetical protein SAMN05421782_10960 [Listeria ivanovii]VEH44960.1 Uncharacterised protein [Listeria ivanovii subsp. londoniensis]
MNFSKKTVEVFISAVFIYIYLLKLLYKEVGKRVLYS